MTDFEKNMQKMLATIQEHNAKTIKDIPEAAIKLEVLQAMSKIPRHLFVPQTLQAIAYNDTPLPIGFEQTISQPYIVAAMTSLLDITKTSTVLEIGTGSGYQTAILAKLCQKVYSIEVIPQLNTKATHVLKTLQLQNVACIVANGYQGYPEHAPFDAIITTAAAKYIPPHLKKELKISEKLVIPIETEPFCQTLFVITREKTNSFSQKSIMPVRFVPMVE